MKVLIVHTAVNRKKMLHKKDAVLQKVSCVKKKKSTAVKGVNDILNKKAQPVEITIDFLLMYFFFFFD